LKLMGKVGGYRDVFDVAVAVQTAQLPIRMAAAGAFKADVAGCVYRIHTRACGVRVAAQSDESVERGRGRLRKIYRKPDRRGNTAESGRRSTRKKGEKQLGISFMILESQV